MPSGADKIKAMLRGATIGFVAVVILLLVPIIGVRKGIQDLVANWQELALYASCLLTGTIAGARLALNCGSIYYDDGDDSQAPEAISDSAKTTSGSSAIAEVSATTTKEAVDSRPEPELVAFEDAVELSLAGEPKKRRLGPFVYYFHHDKDRTLALLGCLYVILYVNCAALCQKLHLGIIVAGDGDTIMRSIGVGTTLLGLYLCLRGVMRTGRHTLQTAEESSPEAEEISVDTVRKEAEGAKVPSRRENDAQETASQTSTNVLDPHRSSPFRMEGSRPVYSSMVSHIPPTRFRFIRRNPICLGALLIFSGLPLVFHAWFPLVAIPGIFIVMSWLFSGDKEKPGSLVVRSTIIS